MTFVFTDIEGSTKRWELYSADMEKAVRRHDELMRTAFAENGGRVFKTIGDAFCVAFPRPQDAVAAAATAQRSLAAEDFAAVDGLRVRMAIHTGTADERDGDYFGTTVNRVARILAVGNGGQVLISGVAADLVVAELPPHATMRDLGQHRLRDLERPEQIYQLVLRDVPGEFPPLRSLDRLPNNLPVHLTSFVGRDDDVREITNLLETHRIVTLVGSGGVGKSRASLQVAANVLDGSAGGVWLIELAPLTDGALITATIASALGIVLSGEDQVKALVTALGETRLLLVLDNCEHIIDAAAAVVAAIVQRCPRVAVLASSRQPLGIDGEIPYRMPSLGFPPDDSGLSADAALAFGSIALFSERAKVANRRFELTDANAGIVGEICRRLDGIPLAIELAAARVAVLSPPQLCQRLNERFRLLAGANRTALPRQQTLRALVDWSYDLLDEAERLLFDRFGIFVGACTLEAITAVCAGDALDELDVFDRLASLVDKSLVIMEDDDTSSRYRMLETIRVYSVERLSKRGEADLVSARHLAFYLALAREANRFYERSARESDLAPIAADQDNIRAAVDRSLEEGGDVFGGAELSILARWSLRDHRENLARLRPFLTRDLEADPRIASLLRSAISPTLFNFGEHQASRTAADESLTYAERSGDETAMFSALYAVGTKEAQIGNRSKATEFLERAREIAGDRQTILQRRRLLFADAYVEHHVGDPEKAAVLYSRIVDNDRALNNRGGLPSAFINLGDMEFLCGRTERAIAIAREGLELVESQRQFGAAIIVSTRLCAYFVAEGRIAEAFEIARQAMQKRRELVTDMTAARLLDHLAVAYASDGDREKAAILSGFTHAIYTIHGYAREQTETVSWKRLERELAELPPAERAALEARGAALSFQDALALALP